MTRLIACNASKMIIALLLTLHSALPGADTIDPASAETPDELAGPAASGGAQNDEGITLLQRTEAAHILFSTGLERTARKIDSFFAEEKSFDEATETYARVRADTTVDEQGQLTFSGDIKIKVDLPRTERELKLLIETDTKDGTTESPQDTPIDVIQKQDYLLSIERVRQLETWDIRPAAGIKLRWLPDPFLRVRAIRYRELGNWLERISGSLFWFASEGAGVNTALEFNRDIGETLLFRSITSLQWKEDDQFLSANQLLSLYQPIDQRQYLVYQLGAQASQDPDWAVTQYTAAVHYRKNIYKKWLFFELIPQIDYKKENDYDAEPSITFRLEGVFGRDYL